MNKALAVAQGRNNHCAWVIALGADRDEAQRGLTYRKLRAIERRLDMINVKACNGELAYDEAIDGYPEAERAYNQATAKVMRIFGGNLPDGFFINTDPRGYALKINDNTMRDYFEHWRSQGINAYTDWGGYGILAPDFD